MTRQPKPDGLSKRERQIMDVLYKLEQATVGQVLSQLGNQAHYSTVRAQLRILEQKGHAKHDEIGLRYVYSPVVPRDEARRSALRHLMDTFFDGSAEKVVSALVGGEVRRLTPEELGRLKRMVAKSEKENASELDQRRSL